MLNIITVSGRGFMITEQFNSAAADISKQTQELFDAVGLAFNNKQFDEMNVAMNDLEKHLARTGVKITFANLKLWVDVDAALLMTELASKGYPLDDEALNNKAFQSKDPLNIWQIAQSLSEPRTGRGPEFFDAIADYNDFQAIATATELETRSGQTTKRLPILWDALRAGRLGHVMDLYDQAKKRFPIEFLNGGRTKHRIGPMQVAAFVNEPDLTARVMSPARWVHHLDDFEVFVRDKMPAHIKSDFDPETLSRTIRHLSLRKCQTPATLKHRVS